MTAERRADDSQQAPARRCLRPGQTGSQLRSVGGGDRPSNSHLLQGGPRKARARKQTGKLPLEVLCRRGALALGGLKGGKERINSNYLRGRSQLAVASRRRFFPRAERRLSQSSCGAAVLAGGVQLSRGACCARLAYWPGSDCSGPRCRKCRVRGRCRACGRRRIYVRTLMHGARDDGG